MLRKLNLLRYFFIVILNTKCQAQDDEHGHGCLTTMKILGGQRCAQSTFPSIVQIMERIGGDMHTKCGGTIIKEDLVLTAAHCLGDAQMYIRMATDNYPENDDEVDNERTKVINQWAHPLYNYTWFEWTTPINTVVKLLHVRHDIAILRFELAPNVVHWRHAIATLPSEPLGQEICNFCNLIQVLGWGRVDAESGSGTLRCATIPVTPMRECTKDHPTDYKPEEKVDYLCTTTHGRMALNGDSGGPAVCRNTLVAVVSWGRLNKGFAVYTRVDRHLDFINDIIKKTEINRIRNKVKWNNYEKTRRINFFNDVFLEWDMVGTYLYEHIKPYVKKTCSRKRYKHLKKKKNKHVGFKMLN